MLSALRKENGKILVKTEGEEKEYDGVFIYRSAVALDMFIEKYNLSGLAYYYEGEEKVEIGDSWFNSKDLAQEKNGRYYLLGRTEY